MEVHDIVRARSAIPILNQTLYLNTGTAGLTAQPVKEILDLFNPPLVGSGTITWASPVTFVEGAS